MRKSALVVKKSAANMRKSAPIVRKSAVFHMWIFQTL